MKQKIAGVLSDRQLWLGGFLCLGLLFSACSSEEITDVEMENLAIEIPVDAGDFDADGKKVEMNTISFSAIAQVEYCYGENIRFYGLIDNKVNQVTDANGNVHYTRHWTIKGLDAEGLSTGDTFTVIAGAEMFTITNPSFNGGPNAAESGKIFIHQGTIVLENNDTGDRLIIRHVIKKHPRTGEVTGYWLCQGNKKKPR